MLILRDIGQMRKMTERPDDPYRLIARQVLRDNSQLLARSFVRVPMKTQPRLADGLDRLKTLSPSWARIVSPRMRPRRRMS